MQGILVRVRVVHTLSRVHTVVVDVSKLCSIVLCSVGELFTLLDFPAANRKLLLSDDRKPPRCHLVGSLSCTSIISFVYIAASVQ